MPLCIGGGGGGGGSFQQGLLSQEQQSWTKYFSLYEVINQFLNSEYARTSRNLWFTAPNIFQYLVHCWSTNDKINIWVCQHAPHEGARYSRLYGVKGLIPPQLCLMHWYNCCFSSSSAHTKAGLRKRISPLWETQERNKHNVGLQPAERHVVLCGPRWHL